LLHFALIFFDLGVTLTYFIKKTKERNGGHQKFIVALIESRIIESAALCNQISTYKECISKTAS
jgi:hypothetical protein